jgi:hypothetical protein
MPEPEPLDADTLAEAMADITDYDVGPAQYAAAVWPLIRDAIDAERLAATRDAIHYTAAPGDWRGVTHDGELDDLSRVRGSEVCPVCDELRCDAGCPLAPIRHQEPPQVWGYRLIVPDGPYDGDARIRTAMHRRAETLAVDTAREAGHNPDPATVTSRAIRPDPGAPVVHDENDEPLPSNVVIIAATVTLRP